MNLTACPGCLFGRAGRSAAKLLQLLSSFLLLARMQNERFKEAVSVIQYKKLGTSRAENDKNDLFSELVGTFGNLAGEEVCKSSRNFAAAAVLLFASLKKIIINNKADVAVAL